MSVNNGVDSSSFNRDDVIRTYLVTQYFGTLVSPLTQIPATPTPWVAGPFNQQTLRVLDTFGGYTIAEVVTALKSVGILAPR